MIETVIAIGSIPLTSYGTPSTNEVPEAIAPYLAEHDVLLLQNHGALTVGCDLITAYYRMETLERVISVSAETPEEAEYMVMQDYKNQLHILDSSNFTGVTFTVQKE